MWKMVAGALLGTAVIVTAAAAVRFAPERMKVDPTSDMSRIITVERSSLSRTDAPSIVVIGTSRAAFGVNPSEIEAVLSLPARSVVNAAYPGFYDALLQRFVDRNVDYLSKAHLVVLVVDDNFGIYAKDYDPKPQSSLPQFAWPDVPSIVRTWPEPLKRWDQLLASFLPEIRKEMYWFARFSREAIATVQREYLWSMTETGRWKWGHDEIVFQDTVDEDNVSRLVVESYFRGWEFHPKYLAIYERMVRQLKGVRFIAYRMPLAASYVKHRQAYDELHKTQVTAFRDMFQAAGVPFIGCETAAACGLEERIFSDPVHPNREGAKQFSRALAEQLRPYLARPGPEGTDEQAPRGSAPVSPQKRP